MHSLKSFLLLTLIALPLQGLQAQSGSKAMSGSKTMSKGPLKVGQQAYDFQLPSMAGTSVKLSDHLKQGPVVLVFLRGYPGYQCPACSRQVADFAASSADFKAKGATVLYVYPGGVTNLKQRAMEFPGLPNLMKESLLLDQNYALVNRYGVRWNAPNETAYPSTFVIDSKGTVQYAKVSKSHGGRSVPQDVLGSL